MYSSALAWHTLRVLCALCACAPAAAALTEPGGAGVDYCSQLGNLTNEWGRNNSRAESALMLSELGAARRLRLAGGGGGGDGAATRAAHELLRALLVHALRYRAQDVRLADGSALADLALIDEHNPEAEFILSVASTWGTERASDVSCATRVCGVAGARLSVLARGAAPAARRLHARLVPGAPAACAVTWDALRNASCGFLHEEPLVATRTANASNTSSSCPLSICPAKQPCVTVVLGAHEPRAEECRRARALHALNATRVPPLRFAWLSDAELRAMLRDSNGSFLFVDYDLWEDAAAERVWQAPPLPPSPPAPVSLLVADARKLTMYAPAILQLALRFRPSPAMLRRQLADRATLASPEAAACKAAVDFQADVRSWLECADDVCDPEQIFRVYVCTGKDTYYVKIKTAVTQYWKSNFNTSSETKPIVWLVRTDCSDANNVNVDVQKVIFNLTSRARLSGVAAMGGAGASALPATARQAGVPLLLMAPEREDARLGAGARSTAPELAVLADAVRKLLKRCSWSRVALVREEGRCDKQKRSLGLGEALNATGELVTSQHFVQVGSENATLDALLAQDARVVLVDASARTALAVLRTAQARALAPAAGYMWIVLGAAGDSLDEDWLPEREDFSYVSVSGGWRGGPEPAGLGGAAGLRRELNLTLGAAWSPLAAPLADAMLLLLEGTVRLRRARPEHRYDPQNPDNLALFFELVNNVSGVTHDTANTPPPVFAHRWSSSGGELVYVWGAPGVKHELVEPLCASVRDGPRCHTRRAGDRRFSPPCLDVAWAVLACVAALGPPALYAARAARRRRLRRRDRRVEERALLRGGHSAAEAAAAAALSEHAVPRADLRLLDELGGGNYGVVRLAVLRPRRAGAETQAVAVKASRADAPAGAAADLLREAALLASLRHERVVRFVGVCLEGPPLVLMEHAFHGDLRRYLRARRPLAERACAELAEPEAAQVEAPALTRLAREAAAALSYLHGRGLVHRDVRAANCLVTANRSLKLADFGMARRVGEPGRGRREYLCRRRALFPVLWMAPESLARGASSPATDVWALGVLLLELATLGERPFGAWPARHAMRHVLAGGAPPLPRDAAPSLRDVVVDCWRAEPLERPTAAKLVALLAEQPRAVQPALEPLPGTDADADPELGTDLDDEPTTPDSGVYIDEWTAN